MSDTLDLTIQQGSTFTQVLRWEVAPIIYDPISAITQSAPARITSALHNIPDGWRAAIVSVKGMSQINATNSPVKNSDYQRVTVVDANTVTLNEVNAASYSAYTSGGYLQYNSPASLAGFTARMAIKTMLGGDVLLSLTTQNGGIVVDDIGKTITLNISATDTAAITWTAGVYDLEMVSAAGVVTQLVNGAVLVNQEITT